MRSKGTNTYLSQLKLGFIIAALVIITQICFGQSLTYDQTQNIEFTQAVSNGTTFESYQMQDGSVININDNLTIGNPLTNSGRFTYIMFGKYSLGGALLSTPVLISSDLTREKVVVTKIAVSHTKASRKSPLSVLVYVKNPAFSESMAHRTIGNFDKAIEVGEVINPNGKMSRELAIAKLKESKDLLDLGIITQQKYDSIKTALTPLITGN